MSAVTFTDGGNTFTYTVKSTQQLNSGVKHSRLRFTSPRTLNVQIVEVNLADPNVRVESALGTGVPFKAQSLVNLYNAKKNAGLKPLVVQNANFWAMSSQGNVIDDGKYAANSCLGGFMVNDNIIFETNYATDTWVGGPSIHGELGIADGKAVIDNMQTNVRLMCPARWGSNEDLNILQPTLVNKFCHYGTLAVFTKDFPSTRAIQVIDSRNGQPGSVMSNGEGIYVYLKLKSGQSQGYNAWCEYTIQKIDENATSGTRGDYDLVIVGTTDAKNIMGVLQVGDTMRMKYYWHPQNGTTPYAGFHNLVAGNSVTMKGGAITSSYAAQSGYNDTQYSRSGYGVSADGKKLIMCIIDKSTDTTYGQSTGCTAKVMSYIMKHFGASDVLNCDAGGSAQMVIGGKQVGTPSDSRGIVGSVVVYDIGSTNTGGNVNENDAEQGTTQTAISAASGNANPFAYFFNSVAKDGQFSYGYSLNAPAKSAQLEIYLGDEIKKTVQLTGNMLTAGTHNGTVSISDLPEGEYSWGITTEGTALSKPVTFGSVKFNHPQGVDVMNRMEDPFFGTILVTEGRPTTNTAHFSQSHGGQGLYLFYPNLTSIDSKAHRQGLSAENLLTTVAQNTKVNGSSPRKVRITEEGRIFVTTQTSTASPLYEAPSISDMVYNDASFTQVTGGPISTTDWTWTTSGGAFSSAPNVGLAVKGSREDLTIALLGGNSTLFATAPSAAGTTCNTYELGTAKTWGGKVPTSTISALQGKYLLNYTGANLNYDNKGGLWFSQYRDSPSATQPAIVYVAPDGTVKYTNTSLVIGGGGFRFNPDYTQVAISSSITTLSIFDITWKNGVPTLTEKLKITHGMGKNVNDYAWDLANNLYAVSNSNELLKGFAIPRVDNTITTKAAQKWNFTVGASTPQEPVPDVVKVTPESGKAPNPAAYDLSSTIDQSSGLPVLIANYTLNADAKGVVLSLNRIADYNGTPNFARRKANTAAEIGDVQKTVTLSGNDLKKGTHTVNVPLLGLEKGEYTWAIQVEGTQLSTVQEFGAVQFNHPQGVAVVRDSESPYFNYVLVTDGRPTTDVAHWSQSRGGQGLYIMKPLLNDGVKNQKTGKYAFKGGLSDACSVGTATTNNGATPRKVRISDDGRIFISTQTNSNNPIYEVPDLETLVAENSNFTPIINGTWDATNYVWKNAAGEVLSGPNVGMDVKGSGDNLTILNANGGKNLFTSINAKDASVDEIPLGTSAQFSGTPATVAPLNHVYAISMSSINVAYDNHDGFWWVQHRGSPSESFPAIKYIAGDGTIKYSDATSVLNGGGVAFDPDYNFLAMSSGSGQFSLYNVRMSSSGVPTLVERYRITHGMGSGVNDFSWDNAGNIYAVSNNNEWLKGFAIPRENNNFATTQASPAHRFTMYYATTGIEDVEQDGVAASERAWSAYGGVGTITITGEANKIEIFNLEGKCVKRNKREVRVKKGVYIVRVDGASIKVAVK